MDVIVETAAKLGIPLKIAGAGPMETLKQKAGKNIEFLGFVSDEERIKLLQNAKALIVTQEEDFGISIVEAQACGIPVIAYGEGGQKEIIIENKTGLFFEIQSAQSLKDAIEYFSRLKWSKAACRKNALRFSRENFIFNLKAFVKEYGPQTIRI